MKKLLLLPLVLLVVASFWSCGGRELKEEQTIITGRLNVLVDDCLSPVMEEQVAVFEHLYEHTEVELLHGPENQIVARLLDGTAEVIVLTRQLNENENRFFEARQFNPRVSQFATDAVAFIANRSNLDSVLTVDDIIAFMRGEPTSGRLNRLVFDNPNSSTVRFLKDLAGVDSLPNTGIYAMKSNGEVVKHVYETPQSIGVLGISWIVRRDSSLEKYMDRIKVMGIKNQAGKPGSDGYYKPSQSNLAEGIYPLSRPVYIINAEPRKSLGMGFAAFLTGVSGQRIILKSGLMPDSLPPRELIIR